MYCMFNGNNYGYEEGVLEVIFLRQDNSVDFNKTW